MASYIVRRVMLMVPLILVMVTITFMLMHAVEGGPFDSDRPLPPATRQRLEQRYGLDKPLVQQYGLYLVRLAQFDLGISFANDRPVRDLIGEHILPTAQLGITAFVFAVVTGVGLGTLSALNQNGPWDYAGVIIATVGAAMPSFVLAPLLVIVFVLQLHWFDVLGWEFGNYRKMVLPTIAIGVLPMAFLSRITRAALLDVLSQDYVRTARAKGLSEFHVVFRHMAKNALIPVLTVAGLLFAHAITGSFIVEQAFAIPGTGREFINSVLVRDYGVMMGLIVTYTLVYAVMTLIVDVLYAVVDPRIRY
ncbi:MAG: ABC transporter permease [Chloroflexi bacterium]|nr:MAG: ABC transporter permease [Chloroflexota bacterium]